MYYIISYVLVANFKLQRGMNKTGMRNDELAYTYSEFWNFNLKTSEKAPLAQRRQISDELNNNFVIFLIFLSTLSLMLCNFFLKSQYPLLPLVVFQLSYFLLI